MLIKSRTSVFLIVITVFLFTITACSTQKETMRPSSLQTNVVENQDLFRSLSLAATSEGERGLLGPLTGSAVTLARDAVVGIIDREKEKAVLSHTDARSDLYFYDQLSDVHPLDPTGIRFDGLDIVRWKSGESAVRDTALYVSLKLDRSNPNELLNNSIFRLSVADLKVNDSEVRLGKTWYKPWSWFRKNRNELNLTMIITFYASWIDENMVIHSDVPMGRFVLGLRNVPLKGHPGHEEFLANAELIPVRGFSYIIPRSMGFAYDDNFELVQKYGQGRFSVKIDLTESRIEDPKMTTMVRLTEDILDGVNLPVPLR